MTELFKSDLESKIQVRLSEALKDIDNWLTEEKEANKKILENYVKDNWIMMELEAIPVNNQYTGNTYVWVTKEKFEEYMNKYKLKV